jgi:hypothetical protein
MIPRNKIGQSTPLRLAIQRLTHTKSLSEKQMRRVESIRMELAKLKREFEQLLTNPQLR